MQIYQALQKELQRNTKTWLITGVAGFIGSNLLETLLLFDQRVIGLDNYSTGHFKNMEEVQGLVSNEQWERFSFVEGDIRDLDTCLKVSVGVDFVLHQAALSSVPRSIEDPLLTNENNITGFINMLVAARDCSVKRFVYAASSSTYGDHPALPKIEDNIGHPLSPYAVTKYVNELYADVFAKTYGMEVIGLRYFNIFGKRQDPNGAYAAVIPKWFAGLVNGETVAIYGDGETSRDFCYIDNCVQANLLAACTQKNDAINKVYNIAYGERTTLNDLFLYIRERVAVHHPHVKDVEAVHREFRAGDVKHSLADISKAKKNLGYGPQYSVKVGLDEAAEWYIKNLN